MAKDKNTSSSEPTIELQKRTRTPRTAESILKGALSLPLADRVAIKKEIEISIKSDLETMEKELTEARNAANGVFG